MENITNRIKEADPGELVVITYELILENIDCAIKNSNQDKNEFDKYIKKTQELLKTLINSLDLNYPMSQDLLGLYIYINKTLIKAMMKNSIELLEEVKKIINTLLEAFRHIVTTKQYNNIDAIPNTNTIYTNVTYGIDTINELAIDISKKDKKD